MITIITGTNRSGNLAQHFSRYCHDYLQRRNQPVQYFSLEDLPEGFFHNAMYTPEGLGEDFLNIYKNFIKTPDKLLFVVPEYNGGMPGVLKLFIDACSIFGYGEFSGTKAAILGIASGRAGNLRGLEHLTSILNFLDINVLPNRLPVSSIEQILSENKEIEDEGTRKALSHFLEAFVVF